MESNNLPKAQCWQDFEDVIEAGINRVILFGPTGTGKTYGGLTMGINEAGSHRLICSEEMTSADVTGSWMPNANGGFEYLLGYASKAWMGNGTKGARLVIDECDKASGDVSSLLLAMTDSEASATMELPTGEVIRPLDGFSVVMTSNIEHPDDLPVALRDRFPVALEINAPHPNALMTLPERLRVVASAVITAEPDRRASIRAFYAFATLEARVGTERASRLAFGEYRGEAVLDALKATEVA